MSDSKRLTSLLLEYLNKAVAGTLPGGSLTIGSPNKIGQGAKTIIQNNTAEALSDVSVAVRSLWLQTPTTNSNVYIGDANVNGNSPKLEKDSEAFLDVSDLTGIYVYGTAGDKVYYLYTYVG